MPAKRKYFECEVCKCKTSSTSPNYYKQRKKYGISRCQKCGQDASSKTIKDISKNVTNNKSLVEVICQCCGGKRQVSNRQSKIATLCASCAAKKSRRQHKELYDKVSSARIGNDKFKKSIVNGMKSIDKDMLIKNAKNAASYWKNEEKKEIILKDRDTEEYRNKLKEIWKDDDYRLKMSKLASEKLKQLWKDNDYRLKMAKVRSRQLTQNRSRQHVHLCDILDDLGIAYCIEHVIGPWAFDCFIESMNILIEVQGDYWHSLPKAVRLDKSKSTYINRYYPNYKIIYFYEHEFYQNNSIIDRLKYELGISLLSQIDFDFNQVKLKLVDAKSINDFMYKYHYIGPINHSLNLGYFINDQIIACCSFSPITRKESATRLSFKPSDVKELSRFCIHPKFQKKNFASWAISKAIRWIKTNKQWKVIISFSDETVGHNGTIYKASNFKYDGMTGKSYYYISNTGYVMHKKTLYNRAIKMAMTEKEFANKYEYTKKITLEKHRFLYYL